MKGFPDLKATKQLDAEMERHAARLRVGQVDPGEEHRCQPLTVHLKEYAAYLKANENCPQHIQVTVAKV